MSQYECAVCHQRRNETTKLGPNFWTAPNGGRICHDCIDTADKVKLTTGQFIFGLVVIKDRLWAVNRTGNVRYPIQGSIETSISFTDELGWIWKGRWHPESKTAYFQRSKKNVLVPPAAKAKGQATSSPLGVMPTQALKPTAARPGAKKRGRPKKVGTMTAQAAAPYVPSAAGIPVMHGAPPTGGQPFQQQQGGLGLPEGYSMPNLGGAATGTTGQAKRGRPKGKTVV